MRYHLDENSINLGGLQERLEKTDLIPSQEPLLVGISGKMSALGKAGIVTVADLRKALKTTTSVAGLSDRSGVNSEYLQLLRRTVNGFFPKPKSLSEADWLDDNIIEKLTKAGIKNTRQFFELSSVERTKTGVDQEALLKLLDISDLCRIQWVSASFARVLVKAGYKNAAAIAKADPDAVYTAVLKANEGARFYKGKVGLRDIKRLVAAAGYLPLQ